jgi:hypothetical protein
MADNDKNDPIDQASYASKSGYCISAPKAKPDPCFDEVSLLGQFHDYAKISNVALNDSQVSIAQAMMNPSIIAKLNPGQEPIASEFLGTFGTHHWGMALKTVYAMRNGALNPFPRTAALLALTAKIAEDTESK